MSVTFGGRNSSHHVDLSGLRLTGQSVAPVYDAKHDHNPKSNPRRVDEAGARTLDKKAYNEQRVFVKKERQGFGGGFKILEEYRRNKMKRKGEHRKADDEEDQEQKEASQVTKDEIFQLLSLGNAEGSIGAGKYGNTSKKALTNDLIEGLEKDLERLKRFEENLRIRKLRTIKGGDKIINETDEDRKNAAITALHQDVESRGGHIIEANQERMQLMRHKAGQLDSLKNLNIHELENKRLETQRQIDELTEIYLQQKEGEQGPGVAKMMRRKMGYNQPREIQRVKSRGSRDQDEHRYGSDDGEFSDELYEAVPVKNGKRSRSIKQKELRFGEDDHQDLDFERDEKDTPPTRSRSRKNRSRKNKSRVDFDEPRVAFGEPKVAFGEPKVAFGDDKPLKSGFKNAVSASTPALNIGNIPKSRGSRDGPKSRGSSKSRSVGYNKSMGRSSGGGREFSEPKYGIGGQGTSGRREAFEAKFDKYRVNRRTKDQVEKRSTLMQQPDFDITTKNRQSPSKKTRKYTTVVGAEIDFKPSGKFEKDTLMPDGYEEHLMREALLDTRKDPFKVLSVSPEDKMTFFLLKWVFDYIKQEPDEDDEQLSGKDDEQLSSKAYVAKKDLVSQLSKNPELMSQLEIRSKRELNDQVDQAACAKKGCLTWQEFLDYFFLRNATFEDRIDGNDWWNKLDSNGQPIVEQAPIDKTMSALYDDDDPLDDKDSKDKGKGKGLKKYGRLSRGAELLQEFKEVQMTPSLQFLMETRKEKVKFDVDDDFRNMQETKATSGPMDMMRGSGMKKASGFSTQIVVDQQAVDQQLGISREKSQCLLLPSQIETMKQEYENLDKYQDGILKRAEFLKHLRMDMKIVDFIDAQSVRVAGQKNKILTLDQVFYEIERDETYEMMQLTKQEDAINHKEFITWREFLSYFEDYKEIEDRNKKAKTFQATRDAINKTNEPINEQQDAEEEFQTLLEAEKERRLLELPKLRPQDMIDISEDQLRLIKGIYDNQQRNSQYQQQSANGGTNTGSASVNTVQFFMALRKHKEVRKILSAIARDPEGHSRLPKETFQQVFDRMEKDMQVKTIEWPTIIEYFTKLGRPLSKDEITRLQDDDKRMREEQQEEKRREEEAERRRMARLMEEINDPNGKNDDEMRARKKPKFAIDNSDDGDISERDDDRVFQGFDDLDDFDSNSGDGYSDDDLSRENEYGERRRENEGDDRRRMARNQSARGLGRGNLNEKRITADDYMHQVREKSLRKGRYGVTVPEPFSFDLRDQQAKKNTIREVKVNEMVMEKKIEVDNMVKHQFRHKPIPAAVLIPRYQQICDKNEERRLRVQQESIAMTKATEKPFGFYKRDQIKAEKKKKALADAEAGLTADCKRPAFKANRMPDFSSIRIYSAEMKLQEESRLKRIASNAEESYARAQMPRRMQQAIQSEKDNPGQKKRAQQEEFTFKPLINEAVTAQQFSRMQSAFAAKLKLSQEQKQVTVPVTQNVELRVSKPLKRDYVNEGGYGQHVMNQATGGDKLKATLAAKQSAKSRTSGGSRPVKQPSSTRSTALLQERKRKELEERREAENKKLAEDKARHIRQNQLKGTVQTMLKPSLKSAQAAIDAQVKERKEQMKKQEKDAAEALEKMKAKVRTGPMIMDNYNKGTYRANNLAKAQTLKKFMTIQENAGISKKVIEGQLTLDDKEVLAEQKFVEAQKKRYGKTTAGEEVNTRTKREQNDLMDDKFGEL